MRHDVPTTMATACGRRIARFSEVPDESGDLAGIAMTTAVGIHPRSQSCSVCTSEVRFVVRESGVTLTVTFHRVDGNWLSSLGE